VGWRKNEHPIFFSEVKKITFWNRISSRLGGRKKVILILARFNSCEVISIFDSKKNFVRFGWLK